MYGEMYGGTPRHAGSSTYPSRISALAVDVPAAVPVADPGVAPADGSSGVGVFESVIVMVGPVRRTLLRFMASQGEEFSRPEKFSAFHRLDILVVEIEAHKRDPFCPEFVGHKNRPV